MQHVSARGDLSVSVPAFEDENIVCHDWMNHSCKYLSNGSSDHNKLYFHPKKRERAPTGHRGSEIVRSYFDPCFVAL